MDIDVDRHVDKDEINLLEIASYLWNRRWLIAAFAAVALCAAIVYAKYATYLYTVELRVTPTQQSSSELSKLGGLAGLASVAGVRMNQDSASNYFALYTENVTSRDVAAMLLKRTDLMQTVFRAEWDGEKQGYREPASGIVRSLARFAKRLVGIPVYDWTPPDAARLQEYIQRHVRVVEAERSPVTRLVMEAQDPAFAAGFLMALHQVVDEGLRQKAHTRATAYIAYLSQQLEKATLVEHRAALAQALSEQERTRMMASSTLPFAAEPLGEPAASPRPTSPRPIIILPLSVVFGVFTGSLFVLLDRQIRRYRQVVRH